MFYHFVARCEQVTIQERTTMLVDLLVPLLLLSIGALYTIRHIKLFRTVEKKTPYTSALYFSYILAAILMWAGLIFNSLTTLDDRISASIPTVRWLLGSIVLILLLIIASLYLLDKRAQRLSK